MTILEGDTEIKVKVEISHCVVLIKYFSIKAFYHETS